MEINTKKLTLLVRFITVALLFILISIVYNVVNTMPYFNKFAALADRLPSANKFDQFRNFYHVVTYISLIKVVFFNGFFGIVLFKILTIVRSILRDGVFNNMQAKKIRQLAFVFLVIASVLLFLNFIFMLAAFNKGHNQLFLGSIAQFFGILENYVVSALITFTIAAVFKSGVVLKEEQELTI